MVPELTAYTQEKVRDFFPMADWRSPVRSETCLYTQTRHAEFLIDVVPDHPDVVVGGGGSGHAFKHGAAIGERLAQLALGVKMEENFPTFQFDYHLETPNSRL